MLGEPLAADEQPAQRYRLLLLAQTATPLEKRAVNKGQVWPASCLASLSAVSENATRAQGDSEVRVEAAVGHGVLRLEFGFTGSHTAVRRHLAGNRANNSAP